MCNGTAQAAALSSFRRSFPTVACAEGTKMTKVLAGADPIPQVDDDPGTDAPSSSRNSTTSCWWVGVSSKRRVVEELDVSGQAGDAPTLDRSLAEHAMLERLAPGGVNSRRPEFACQDLPVQAVEIHTAPRVVLEDGVLGHPRSALVGGDEPEPQRSQRLDGALDVLVVIVDHDVEVIMGPRLSSRQGVDAPTTGKAVRHRSCIERVDHGEDVFGPHGASEAIAQRSEHGPNRGGLR